MRRYACCDLWKQRLFFESELKTDLDQGPSKQPAGVVRIAGYSSVLNTVITPAVAPYLRKFEKVQVHYLATQDVRPPERQVELLLRAEADFLISVKEYSNRSLESHRLGVQELIAVESSVHAVRSNVYLDTRPEDKTTVEFFGSQSFERSFLYDEEGILKAVEEGLGRAVVLRYLIRKGMRVRRVRGTRPIQWPMYLSYRRQPYYLPSIDGIRNAIVESARQFLS